MLCTQKGSEAEQSRGCLKSTAGHEDGPVRPRVSVLISAGIRAEIVPGGANTKVVGPQW